MQTTKKQDNALLMNFIFYFGLTLITAYVLFAYIVIQIIDIENKKQEVQKLYNTIVSFEKQ
jgi:hypothetical protein